jgi:hypothetical protein
MKHPGCLISSRYRLDMRKFLEIMARMSEFRNLVVADAGFERAGSACFVILRPHGSAQH